MWGKAPTPSHSGKEYYVSFVDDYSRFAWIEFMQEKSEVLEIFKRWKTQVENQIGRKVKCLRSDNGGEYMSREFKAYCEEMGIVHHHTTSYTPQQNGVAERLNRTLLEKARSMLSLAGLEQTFWAEAIKTAAYLLNLTPSSAINLKSPFEMRYQHPSDYSKLRVFGCEAYAHIPRELRTKLDPKATKCVFLGYSSEAKAYRLWEPSDCKIIVSRDVTFNELRLLEERERPILPSTKEEELPSDQELLEGELEGDTSQREVEETHDLQEEEEPSLRRSSRTHLEPDRYGFIIPEEEVFLVDQYEPDNFKVAIKDAEFEKWLEAMKTEMESMYDNQVWNLVDLPSNSKVVGSKWVFKKKTDMDENVITYKARLVAKGYKQWQSVDFDESFSFIAMLKSIRILLAIVAYYDYEIR